MQNAPPFVQHARSNRSTILEGMDPEEQLRLEELEQQVEEGMKKFQLYMGRRQNPSGASSWFGTGTGSASPTPKAAAAGTSGKMSEVRPGAAPSDSTGRPREAQGSASSSFSEGLTSWGIEDTELAETTRFPSSAGAALPTTDEDARSLKEALQEALHAENTLLEREVERQRAEIQELKSRPRAAATPMMEPRAVEEPRAIEEPTVVRRVVPPAGVLTAPIQATPASATLSAPTPPRSATNSGCVSPRFTPVSMVSRTPGMPQAITEALLSPRFTTHRAVPAATPTSTTMAGWVYAVPCSPGQAQSTPRTPCTTLRL